jgi:hypothetical protein
MEKAQQKNDIVKFSLIGLLIVISNIFLYLFATNFAQTVEWFVNFFGILAPVVLGVVGVFMGFMALNLLLALTLPFQIIHIKFDETFDTDDEYVSKVDELFTTKLWFYRGFVTLWNMILILVYLGLVLSLISVIIFGLFSFLIFIGNLIISFT